MTVEITRDLIINRLGRVKYDRFLFYLMGPYKSFNLDYVLSEAERSEIDVETSQGHFAASSRARTISTRRRHSCDGSRADFA